VGCEAHPAPGHLPLSFLIYAIDFASWAIRLTAAVYHRRKKGKCRQWNLAGVMARRGI